MIKDYTCCMKIMADREKLLFRPKSFWQLTVNTKFEQNETAVPVKLGDNIFIVLKASATKHE